ncbi:uncharacterized protein LOC124389821 isoform X1 [Xyrichtys novacula]|uniref:Uncharacterized protein LOC124389821 isoform X1 n=1 Tax=Xyrichtys novacula TaxID=13765 RepID=A0AAV1HJX4_XYRNO|nr:uncharacterized protein LOC124389821 isoform X1 [Xyrichtys novacula]
MDQTLRLRGHTVLGHFQKGRKPKKTAVKFLKFKDGQRILSSTKKLKGTNIHTNEGFSDVVQQRRRELLPKLKAAEEKGDRASLRILPLFSAASLAVMIKESPQ